MRPKSERWKRSGITTVLAIVLLAVSGSGYSQASLQKPTRQSALDAFAKEEYESALSDFNYLITVYPKDPLYKYYSGVCLVRLERDPVKAAGLLTEAASGASGIRSVPADCQFWLGRALQMSGEFDKAVEAYNSYTAVAGKKSARDLGVPEYIQQSQNGKGMIAASVAATGETGRTDEAAEKAVEKKEDDVPAVEPDKPEANTAPLPSADDHLLEMALSFRRSSDSLSALASDTRKKTAAAPSAEKESMLKKAENLDNLSKASRDSADRYMALFMKKPVEPQQDEIKPTKPVEGAPAASALPISTQGGNEPESGKTVSVSTAAAEKQVFSSFEVIPVSAGDKEKKVKLDVEIPEGLVYRIQLAVFRNPVAVSYFKGITPITGIKNAGNGVTTYFGGLFRKSSDASKALTRVKSLGFRDAFIAAHMNNKQVSAERALFLEKEWGSKPLYTITAAPSPAADTVPPTLVLRVEVMRTPKPLPAVKLDEIKRLAGPRGMDILVNDSKQNIYLIGKFLTFKSATEYADLLVRNGYRDAKVVAYLGQREIPVETARQLFEQE